MPSGTRSEGNPTESEQEKAVGGRFIPKGRAYRPKRAVINSFPRDVRRNSGTEDGRTG